MVLLHKKPKICKVSEGFEVLIFKTPSLWLEPDGTKKGKPFWLSLEFGGARDN